MSIPCSAEIRGGLKSPKRGADREELDLHRRKEILIMLPRVIGEFFPGKGIEPVSEL